MKTSTKKLASILMVISMSLVLFGCGNSGDTKKFVGTWKYTMDIADTINEAVRQDFAEDIGDIGEYVTLSQLSVIMMFTFNDDGTYSTGVDKTASYQSLEIARGDFKAGITRYFEDMIAEMGLEISADDVLAASGSSMDALIAESLPTDIMDNMAEELKVRGNWKAANGKLYTTESVDDDIDERDYALYEFASDGRSFSLRGRAEDDTEALPMVLTKVE